MLCSGLPCGATFTALGLFSVCFMSESRSFEGLKIVGIFTLAARRAVVSAGCVISCCAMGRDDSALGINRCCCSRFRDRFMAEVSLSAIRCVLRAWEDKLG